MLNLNLYKHITYNQGWILLHATDFITTLNKQTAGIFAISILDFSEI